MPLKENQIDVMLSDNSPPVDLSFSGSKLQDEIEVFVLQSDFSKA